MDAAARTRPAAPYEPVCCSTCRRIARLVIPLGKRAVSCAAMMRATPEVRRSSRYPATPQRYSPGRGLGDTPRHADGALHRRIRCRNPRVASGLWMDAGEGDDFSVNQVFSRFEIALAAVDETVEKLCCTWGER